MDFLNELFNKKSKSLLEFKFLNFSKLDSDEANEIVSEYKKKIKSKLGLIIKKENDDSNKLVISLVKDMLKKIDYGLTKYEELSNNKKKITYSVTDKCKNDD